MKLLIATRNPGKIREFEQLLASLPVSLCAPRDLGLAIEIDEDQETYAGNAGKKALTYARSGGLLTLADDSGLEVEALGGAPGIRSARYAAGDDANRWQTLLTHLQNVPWKERQARFRCAIAIATPLAVVVQTTGICEGTITFEPRGEGGFGYDPVFLLPQYGRTMAQLSPEEKNRVSHRARAVQAAIPHLRQLVQDR